MVTLINLNWVNPKQIQVFISLLGRDRGAGLGKTQIVMGERERERKGDNCSTASLKTFPLQVGDWGLRPILVHCDVRSNQVCHHPATLSLTLIATQAISCVGD